MVLIQVSLDLDGGAVVVAVQPLALVALVADEMPRAEDEVVLADADGVTLRHGSLPRGDRVANRHWHCSSTPGRGKGGPGRPPNEAQAGPAEQHRQGEAVQA